VVAFEVVAARTALINIDLQRYFVDGAADGALIVERVNRLAQVCREQGILVIHTRHVLRPDGSDAGLAPQFAPAIRDGVLNEGAASAELHVDLVVDPRDLVLAKPRFGAFHGSELDEILRSRGIDSAIISGIATNVCCDTTAREANARDLRVFFLSDGTAPSGRAENRAEIQTRSLELMGALFAQVISVEEMAAKIVAGSAGAGLQHQGLESG
jgi:ureidoacrylate peracid hydrolase